MYTKVCATPRDSQSLCLTLQEHVDGELLSCMEETELVELGITSSLHRKRFLKIIEGKHSARLYLEEGDPYGTVTIKQPVDK